MSQNCLCYLFKTLINRLKAFATIDCPDCYCQRNADEVIDYDSPPKRPKVQFAPGVPRQNLKRSENRSRDGCDDNFSLSSTCTQLTNQTNQTNITNITNLTTLSNPTTDSETNNFIIPFFSSLFSTLSCNDKLPFDQKPKEISEDELDLEPRRLCSSCKSRGLKSCSEARDNGSYENKAKQKETSLKSTREKDTREKETREQETREKETRKNDTREKEPREKEPGRKNQRDQDYCNAINIDDDSDSSSTDSLESMLVALCPNTKETCCKGKETKRCCRCFKNANNQADALAKTNNLKSPLEVRETNKKETSSKARGATCWGFRKGDIPDASAESNNLQSPRVASDPNMKETSSKARGPTRFWGCRNADSPDASAESNNLQRSSVASDTNTKETSSKARGPTRFWGCRNADSPDASAESNNLQSPSVASDPNTKETSSKARGPTSFWGCRNADSLDASAESNNLQSPSVESDPNTKETSSKDRGLTRYWGFRNVCSPDVTAESNNLQSTREELDPNTAETCSKANESTRRWGFRNVGKPDASKKLNNSGCDVDCQKRVIKTFLEARKMNRARESRNEIKQDDLSSTNSLGSLQVACEPRAKGTSFKTRESESSWRFKNSKYLNSSSSLTNAQGDYTTQEKWENCFPKQSRALKRSKLSQNRRSMMQYSRNSTLALSNNYDELTKLTKEAADLFEACMTCCGSSNNIKTSWEQLSSNRKIFYYWLSITNETLSEQPYDNFLQYHLGADNIDARNYKNKQLQRLWKAMNYKERLPFILEAFIAKMSEEDDNPTEEEIKQFFASRKWRK